jgi:hypothetical protein
MADPRKDSHLNYGLTQTNVQFRDQNHLNNGQDGLILAGVPNFAIPTSFSALAIGMLNRSADAWLLAYIESEFFNSTQRKIKDRTKVDIAVLLAACVALRKVNTSIPNLLISFLDRFKQQVTSSIKIGIDDSKYHGILRLAAEESSSDCSWWLKLQSHGQHGCLKNVGKIVPQPGKADRFFWHDNTLFSLEVFGSVDSTGDEDSSENAYYRRNNHQSWDKEYLVLRCFGSSHSPIKGLMADVDKKLILSQHLQVTQVMADITKSPILRPKRSLTTIDMDPEQLEAIREDAEAFFDESTPYCAGIRGPLTGEDIFSTDLQVPVRAACRWLYHRM